MFIAQKDVLQHESCVRKKKFRSKIWQIMVSLLARICEKHHKRCSYTHYIVIQAIRLAIVIACFDARFYCELSHNLGSNCKLLGPRKPVNWTNQAAFDRGGIFFFSQVIVGYTLLADHKGICSRTYSCLMWPPTVKRGPLPSYLVLYILW